MGLVSPCRNRMLLTHTKFIVELRYFLCSRFVHFLSFSIYSFALFSNQLEWFHRCNSSIVVHTLTFLHTCTKTCAIATNDLVRSQQQKRTTLIYSTYVYILFEIQTLIITRRAAIPPMIYTIHLFTFHISWNCCCNGFKWCANPTNICCRKNIVYFICATLYCMSRMRTWKIPIDPTKLQIVQ